MEGPGRKEAGGQQEADKHVKLRIGSDLRNEVTEKSNFRTHHHQIIRIEAKKKLWELFQNVLKYRIGE